mgnify:CR=1 FL=1
MSTRNTALSILGCLLLVFGLAATQPGTVVSQQQHCYSVLAPVDTKSSDSSKVLESACFNSFSESIKAATKGRANLDPSVRPPDVTDEMLNSVGDKSSTSTTAQIVIGIDFDNTNYGGSTYTWVVTTSGCTDTVFYSVSSMPAGWDNRVSSAKAYSNCNYFYHYQNINFGTPSVVCNTDCSGMGSLDNATSSEKWQKNP